MVKIDSSLKQKRAYEVQYVWEIGTFFDRRTKNGETIPIYESQYVNAQRQIKKNGAIIPISDGHDKRLIQDDDYLLEGFLFRLNSPSQILDSGGSRVISIFIDDLNIRRNDLSDLVEKLGLPLLREP